MSSFIYLIDSGVICCIATLCNTALVVVAHISTTLYTKALHIIQSPHRLPIMKLLPIIQSSRTLYKVPIAFHEKAPHIIQTSHIYTNPHRFLPMLQPHTVYIAPAQYTKLPHIIQSSHYLLPVIKPHTLYKAPTTFSHDKAPTYYMMLPHIIGSTHRFYKAPITVFL